METMLENGMIVTTKLPDERVESMLDTALRLKETIQAMQEEFEAVASVFEDAKFLVLDTKEQILCRYEHSLQNRKQELSWIRARLEKMGYAFDALDINTMGVRRRKDGIK